MKKLLTCLSVALLMLVCIFVLPTGVQAAAEDDFQYWVVNGEVEIIGYNGLGGKIAIPAKLENLPVTAIGPYAFSECDNLTSVTIPQGVRMIGDCAFLSCYGLTNVSIPNSVTAIGREAFSGCISLKSVSIPSSISKIGEFAFEYCSSLSGIWVNSGNTKYSSDQSGVFFDKNKTVLYRAPATISGSYRVPDSVTKVEQYAFYGCNSLTSVTIGSGVKNIGDSAFQNCLSLKTVQISKSVTSVGNLAFYGCSKLTGISVNAANTVYCSDGRGVLFNKAKTILLQAPGGMSGSYAIPDGVKTVGYYSFAGTRLTSVIITEKVELIDGWAFSDCNSLEIVNYVGTPMQWSAIKIKDGNKCLNNAAIVYDYHYATVKITTQPKNTTAPEGQLISVPVKAVGDGLTYTWYYKNANATTYRMSSITGANYSIKMSAAANGRWIYCVVTDKYGNTEKTNTARLYMGNPVQITMQPKNVTAPKGTKIYVTIDATGDGLKYTWYQKDVGTPSYVKACITDSNYTTKIANMTNGRQIYCIVTDKYGNTARSNTVTLRMGDPVKITTQPKSVSAFRGDKIYISVWATGDGLSYHWYHKNTGTTSFVKASITGATYTTAMATMTNGRQIYCIVKDTYGNSIKSNTVNLTMCEIAKITTQPMSVSALKGMKVNVTVRATGDGLKYAWYHKDVGTSSFVKACITDANYTTKMANMTNGRQIYCVVTDKYGNSVKSNTVKLKMSETVRITSQPKSVVASRGTKVYVSVGATGEGLKYAWYQKDVDTTLFVKACITDANYTTKMANMTNGRQIYCVVSDKYGTSAKTNTVVLKMK